MAPHWLSVPSTGLTSTPRIPRKRAGIGLERAREERVEAGIGKGSSSSASPRSGLKPRMNARINQFLTGANLTRVATSTTAGYQVMRQHVLQGYERTGHGVRLSAGC